MTHPPADQPYAPPPGPGGPGSRPKGMAITALVLGILALVLCWTIIGGILLGLVALVLGIIAAGRAKRGAAGGRGMAITGAVLGVIGAVLAGVLLAIGASFLNSESVQNLEQCLEQAGDDQAAADQCRVEFEEEFQEDFAN